MKKLAFFSFATLAVLLSSCADLASVENTESETNTIAAVMEGVQTKTSTTDEGHFSWTEGDNIWLETTADYVIGTLSAGAGTPNATFNYGSYFGELTGKSVYPYNEGHSVEGDVLNVVLPASYDLGSNLNNTNSPMYGVKEDERLKFNHLAGVMRFSFKNVPAGVDRFVFTVDKKINGTFAADLTADYPVLQTEAVQADAERTVTFNFDALANTSDVKIFVPLPLGTYESLELALYKGEESVWTYSKAVTNTINRKSLKLMPTVSMGGSIGGDIENDGTIGGDIEDEVKLAPADQIWYSATEMVEFNNLESSFFGTLEVKSHDYDPSTQKGIITFTNSVFGIPNSFLANPEVVTDIVLPEDIVYFESLALAGCNFTSVTLPSNVQSMEQYALYSETLKELNVLTTVLSDMSSAVNLAVLEKITGPWASSDGRFLIDDEGNLKAIALSGVTELSIPDGVTAIAMAVNSDKLVKVNRPSSTTTLNMSFASCPALKEVHIDSQNLKGDYNPFYGCTLLEKFSGPLASADGRCLIANNMLISLAGSGISECTIPEGVEEVASYGWYQCKHFQKLTLPSTMINASYMDTFQSLESLYCLSPEPPTGLYSLNETVKVYVPSQSYFYYLDYLGEEYEIYPIDGDVDYNYDYIDESGNNYGKGIEFNGVVWAPVNLGYHATDYPYGKLYQWGRRYGQGYSTDAVPAEVVAGPVYFSNNRDPKEKENIFYSNTNSPFDWTSSPSTSMWTASKGDNDPCPSGWRVPTYDEINTLSSVSFAITTNDKGQKGYLFNSSTSSDSLFLPLSGTYTRGGYANGRDSFASYWSCTPYFELVACSRVLSLRDNAVSIENSQRATGKSVRCVKQYNE